MKKRFCLLIAAALLLSLLCGCGGSGKSEAMPSNYAKNDSAAINAADSSSGWAAEAQTAAEPKAPVQTGTSLPANVKLIYRANIDMESTEFDTAVQGLTDLVARLGGYFENSELDNYANYRRASYVVRLPSENFETFCGAVGELCQVNSLSRSAEDVSERYYDTESRLVTQQTKLARLQELLRRNVTAYDSGKELPEECLVVDYSEIFDTSYGTCHVKYMARDSEGNVSDVVVLSVEVDLEAPVLKLRNEFQHDIRKSKVLEDDYLLSLVEATDNSGAVELKLSRPLLYHEEEPYRVMYYAKDAAGNISTLSVTYQIK